MKAKRAKVIAVYKVFGDLFYKAFNSNQMISLVAWIFRERKGFADSVALE